LFQFGYTRKYELDYQYPYFIGSWGIGGNILYTENKEIGYTNIDNKIQFIKLYLEPLLLQRFRATLNVYRRNSAFLYQQFQLQYTNRWINDSIASHYNPNYFLNGRNTLYYVSLEYDVRFDKRLFPTYPEGGFMLQANIRKEGLGFAGNYNNLALAFIGEIHTNVLKNLFWGMRFKAKTNLTHQQVPYILNNALGFGSDRVRGYELYTIDGNDFLLARTSWRYKVLNKKYNISKAIGMKAFRILPLTIYTRFTTDLGMTWDRNAKLISNPLNKTLLVGYGPALDILLYNNYILSIEYSLNHLGDTGLYFESSFNF
jgi:hypothetical protein